MQSNSGAIGTLGVTFNDGKSVKSGTHFDFDYSHVFDQSKKITKIVTTVKDEVGIMQINFFSGEEVLCRLGEEDDGHWSLDGGRVVTFEIAADEQLIGAELYNGPGIDYPDEDYFRGVTWLKMKIAN